MFLFLRCPFETTPFGSDSQTIYPDFQTFRDHHCTSLPPSFVWRAQVAQWVR